MTTTMAKHTASQCIVICTAVLLAHAAIATQADGGTTHKEAARQYREDVQACTAGRSGQDLATCLKEARHASAARLKGDLATDGASLQANRDRRCDVFTGEPKAACLARMAGRGTVSGSVAGGGILRQVETVVIPADSGPIRIEPTTQDPVILVPDKR